MGSPEGLYGSVYHESSSPVQTLTYWKAISDYLSRPFYMSVILSEPDVIDMLNVLSSKWSAPILVQKIRKQGYGPEEVIWQRYIINGLSSFQNHPSRKTR